MEPAGAIDEPEVTPAEPNDVEAEIDLRQTNRFARQCLADEDMFAPPLDLARPSDASHFMVRIVPGLLDRRRHRAPRRAPAARRHRLAERFVRAFLVVMPAEPIKANLLLLPAVGRWTCRLGLERAVHAFVPAVVLRARWRDMAHLDAELQKPDGKP